MMTMVREVEGTVLPVMIGTAGHVDHGKTSLVRLLTGCETDRLKEEKDRGLTIDLGFAPCRFPGGRIAGIVDVPGHEDFIRNMVAGASTIDILMLVIAADDGIMPQTIEHLRIVSLLRKPQVMVVITKADLVDRDYLEILKNDVSAFMAKAGFESAAILSCSNITMDGISAVRTALRELVDNAFAYEDERAFRINVERRFSVKGFGTVVTGVPISGFAQAGDELVINDNLCRVRSVQSYQMDVQKAVSGACAAINIRDFPAALISRGMTVYAPGAYQKTTGAIILIKNTDDAFTFKRTENFRLHTGTASTNVSVKLIACDSLLPGAEGFAHVRFTEPLVVAAGDKFILRTQSPRMTVGGGTVLSSADYPLRRAALLDMGRFEESVKYLESGDFTACEVLSGSKMICTLSDINILSHKTAEKALTDFNKLGSDGILTKIGKKAWLVNTRLTEFIGDIRRLLTAFHTRRPYYWGIDAENICPMLNINVDAFADLCKILTGTGGFKLNNNRLALADFSPNISKHQMALLEQTRQVIAEAGIRPPARGDLKTAIGACEADMKLIFRLLTGEGEAYFIDNYLVSKGVVDECRGILLDFLRRNDEITIAQWRDISGASRNFAVGMLEFFDSSGLTRRSGEVRVLSHTE